MVRLLGPHRLLADLRCLLALLPKDDAAVWELRGYYKPIEAPVDRVHDATVRRYCIERLGIAESDIRRVTVFWSSWQYVVRLWNHRKLILDAESVLRGSR